MTNNVNFNFYKHILKNEGLVDWSIKIIHSGGGLCCGRSKEIWLDEKELDNNALFLHEVAHANTERGHDGIFADEFTRLVNKYMCLKQKIVWNEYYGFNM